MTEPLPVGLLEPGRGARPDVAVDPELRAPLGAAGDR